jgi:hypothetical protein
MKATVTMREALADPELLGTVLAGTSWAAWRTLLIAAMGEPLDNDERELFAKLTGGRGEPGRLVEEFVGVIGRRGGKSYAISVLAAYIAALCSHPALVRGERGVLLIIAPDQRQAMICLDYITAIFDTSPILRQLVETRTQWTLRLTNGIDIEVRAADFRRLRGPTYIAVITDEIAYLFNEYSANPDSEILGAVRPGLSTTSGPLFVISSPYSRKGEPWRLYNKHFGPNGDPLILVAQAASRVMNPSLPQSIVDRAMERDPASAAAEYGGEFRRDIESFIAIEAVQACVLPGVRELPPASAISYTAFVDPSGGSSDSMTLAVAHRDKDGRGILDAVRERRPPFSPDGVVQEFAELLKSYGVRKVTGDRYAGEWPRKRFRVHGVEYVVAEKPKSALYGDMLPLLNSGKAELLDHPRLVAQLCGLERRTARSGKDSIDHGPGGHDDIANACAGALVLAAGGRPAIDWAAVAPAIIAELDRTPPAHRY